MVVEEVTRRDEEVPAQAVVHAPIAIQETFVEEVHLIPLKLCRTEDERLEWHVFRGMSDGLACWRGFVFFVDLIQDAFFGKDRLSNSKKIIIV